MNIGGFVIAALFIVLAAIFLMGKGDKLIAGYNTSSEEERKGINIHRLRILMAIVSVISACFCTLLSFIGEDRENVLTATFFFIVITFVVVVLANTWAKKK